jgi:DNA invertase Pin-like site-specific DNA recombinase
MRVIIVARLSKQGRGDAQTGIETQDEYARHWAESKGYKVVALIADKRSGIVQPWDRPNLKPWVTDPTLLAKYDSIVAYRLDRLSRGDNKSTSEIEAWAYKYGKQLLTEDGLVFPCEGAAGIRWDVTKRIAHEEWLEISERNTRMQAYLRQEGFQVGKAPTGYRIVRAKGGEHKTIEHNPNVAPYVRLAVEHYVKDGWTAHRICAWLESEGIKPAGYKNTNGHWWPKTLTRLFRNPALYGRIMSKGRTIYRTEGIVTRAEWDELQALLDAKGSRRGIARGSTAMLTSIAKCGLCKGPMYRIKAWSAEFCRCYGTSREPSKCANMILLGELDSWVNLWLVDEYGETEIVEVIFVPSHGYDDELADNRQELVELDPDDPDYDSKHAALMAERKRLRSLPPTSGGVLERSTGILFKDYWPTLTPQERRDHLLRAGVIVHASPEGRGMTGDPTRIVGALTSV